MVPTAAAYRTPARRSGAAETANGFGTAANGGSIGCGEMSLSTSHSPAKPTSAHPHHRNTADAYRPVGVR